MRPRPWLRGQRPFSVPIDRKPRVPADWYSGWALPVETKLGLAGILGDVQLRHAAIHQQRRGGFVQRAINAVVVEVSHLHQVADEGESAATPAILVGAVLMFVAPIVAIVMLLVFGVADLS